MSLFVCSIWVVFVSCYQMIIVKYEKSLWKFCFEPYCNFTTLVQINYGIIQLRPVYKYFTQFLCQLSSFFVACYIGPPMDNYLMSLVHHCEYSNYGPIFFSSGIIIDLKLCWLVMVMMICRQVCALRTVEIKSYTPAWFVTTHHIKA